MSLGSCLRLFAVGGLFAGLAVACAVETDHGGSGGGSYLPPSGTSTRDAGGTTTGNTVPSAHPILVDVDTGQKMNAKAGEGVGVFTEYVAGGHWHVWWTCDTNTTGASCGMDVTISVATGAISNATADASPTAGAVAASTPQQIEVLTTTSTSIDGVHFDTDPGAVITLTASVGDGTGQSQRLYDGSFLFFVQKGKVNGGFTGTLTDPLMLEGSLP